MDSRVVLIAVVLAVVLLALGIARHYIGKWFRAHPVWSIVATVGVFVIGFLVVANTPQFSAWLDCLSTHRLICLS
ncbi:hypothetical protein [Paraburkholderia kururiensis]|uniref:hypothetical protein n=1 Tax=Paraburkholderia kururiensis TaxID=984307 RepID=UPI00034C8591|nr:hypothetical protein [Paraburkholderia kururiensis]